MKKNGRKRRTRHRSIGPDLIASVRELHDALASGAPLERHFTVRTIQVNEPDTYRPAQVRQLRHKLAVSQTVFARMIGISTQLVEHWEQGVREPKPWARRLLDLISSDTSRFMELVATDKDGISKGRRRAG